MPFQKMTDALQMDVENRKRQERLVKGRELLESAVAEPDSSNQSLDVEADPDAQSTAAVEESTGLPDEAATPADHQENTSLPTGTSVSLSS